MRFVVCCQRVAETGGRGAVVDSCRALKENGGDKERRRVVAICRNLSGASGYVANGRVATSYLEMLVVGENWGEGVGKPESMILVCLWASGCVPPPGFIALWDLSLDMCWRVSRGTWGTVL